MRHRIIGLLVVLLGVTPAAGAGLPRVVGCFGAPPPKTFNPKTIYTYLDGAAEVYRMHGFRALEVFRFRRLPRRGCKEAGGELKVEVFDMGSSEGAFGAFSHARDVEGEVVSVGQDGHYQSGVLWFWKGRHLVCVSRARGGEQAGWRRRRKATHAKVVVAPSLRRLAGSIARLVGKAGRRPDLVQVLPEAGLRPRTVRYFRSSAALSYHYGAVEAKLFGIGRGAEAVLADYRLPSGAGVLLVVRYPDAKRAVAAENRVQAGYLGRRKAAQLGSGRWGGLRRKDRQLWVVLEAANRGGVRALLGETRGRP